MGTLRPKRGHQLLQVESLELVRSFDGCGGGGIWKAVGLILELLLRVWKAASRGGAGRGGAGSLGDSGKSQLWISK